MLNVKIKRARNGEFDQEWPIEQFEQEIVSPNVQLSKTTKKQHDSISFSICSNCRWDYLEETMGEAKCKDTLCSYFQPIKEREREREKHERRWTQIHHNINNGSPRRPCYSPFEDTTSGGGVKQGIEDKV